MTLSRSSRRRAVSATCAWPSCAGLNEPPKRPTRMPGLRWNPGLSAAGRPPSGTRLAGPADHIFVSRELLGPHGAAGVHAVGGDPDLGAEAELAAIRILG